MINLLFLITLLIAVPSHADGPKYRHQEPFKQLEFENVYLDIRSIPRVSSSSLPSGSTQYIQNSATLQSGAVFNVSSGTVDGSGTPFTVKTSGTGFTQILNGTGGRGAMLGLYSGATNTGAVGSSGVWKGDTSSDTAVAASAGLGVRIYTDGSSSERVTVSPDGEIVQPLQPSFLASMSASGVNVTGDGTSYTVNFDTERFDQGDDFSNSTFTAPVSGRYNLSCRIFVSGQSALSDSNMRIITSNQNYYGTIIIGTFGTNGFSLSADLIADMDANDTAYCLIAASGGTKVVDVLNGDGGGRYAFFSGSLIN